MRYSTDIVVIDLEATCPEEDIGDNLVARSNIIEIGAVRLDRRSLEVKASFSELVRPIEYPLTSFITELTGITHEMLADREDFGAVGRRFLEWYGPRNKAILAAFGAYYDVPLLRRDCLAHGIDYSAHIAGGALDIRAVATVWLAEREFRTSGLALKDVLDKMGAADERTLHRAVDDARAAAAILQVFHLGRALV